MKPEYKKKKGRGTLEKRNDRDMRKNSSRHRVTVPPLEVVLDNTIPGGFRMEPVHARK